ncbi:MAG: PQQ-binding-like beta-propeller repeat protein [Methanoregula sp.]|nr:PQQ-binding-like beta-propeller repeat protein [Methanoregula sp.]
MSADSFLAMSANSSHLASISGNRIILVTEDGRVAWNSTPGGDLRQIKITSGGERIAAASWNRELVILDGNGTLLWKKGLPDHILDLAVAGDGSSILTAGMAVWPGTGGNVTLTDGNGTMVWNYRTPVPVGSIAQSDDGKYIVAGASGYSPAEVLPEADLFFLDNTGHLLWSVTTHGGNAVAMDRSGSSVAVVTSNKNILAFYTRDGSRLFTHPLPLGARGVTLSPDGNSVYIAVTEGEGPSENTRALPTVICLDRKGQPVWNYSPDVRIENSYYSSLHASGNGHVLVAGSSGGIVSILDENGVRLSECSADGPVQDVALSDNGKTIGVRTGDSLYRITWEKPVEVNLSESDPEQSFGVTAPPGQPAQPTPTRQSSLMITVVVVATGISLAVFRTSRKQG